jgi:2-polyprenyl-3-methyl-5-hydroxy-6-metoxy-1,4-benzoquinol methylase
MRHFNGISWCPTCKEFTCVNCAEERMIRKEFFIYDYYYSIPCYKCGLYNPALDFAEYDGTHPFQIGDLKPSENVNVWMPISKNELLDQESHHRSGFKRMLSLGKTPTFKRLETLNEYNPKTVWDAMAPFWLTVEEENYHHKYLIMPDVIRMLDAQKGDKILDVACGKGDYARQIAKNGAKVTGIDISKMIDYAIETEKKEKLGINYLQLNAENLLDKFEKESFDKVLCNMALMDIEKLDVTLRNIASVLKENGIFVFSIAHPAFAWPTCMRIVIPGDSKRNEDKIRIVLDYFDERPVVFSLGLDPPRSLPSLNFHRPISRYINELTKSNLVIREMSEPKASEELVQKFPKNAYLDDDIWPEFLIMKTVKITSIP